MAMRVTLDAMIPREDFAIDRDEFEIELLRDFPINNLSSDSPIIKLLRKPDFQRETNHWSPDQIATFIASFLDNEVIPSIILWKSPAFLFVIDGGHRLSAIRAWMEDDYGDGPLSLAFYRGGISEDQKRIAKRTRQVIEQRIGRFTVLKGLVDTQISSDPLALKRANRMFTRPLNLQWVQGNADVAETSFFKINSQGTPLDDTEEMLIKNRRKPIAIGSRAVLRSGTGHKYWSAFSEQSKRELESIAEQFYDLLFEPEASVPLKTLDVPFGGTVSPVDALSLLVEFLTVAGSRETNPVQIAGYPDDGDGTATINILKKSLEVIRRITGNHPGCLGLHPAVYFYNERGKYNRFLFLGMVALITEKIRDNDGLFFKKFTNSRSAIERFLIENKSLITLLLQNLGKGQRVPKMRDLFRFLVNAGNQMPTALTVLEGLGISGRILDVTEKRTSTQFSDDTKSMLFIDAALKSALTCPICGGYILPSKSVSYDHKVRVREGGKGDPGNGQMVHPFCNTGVKG